MALLRPLSKVQSLFLRVTVEAAILMQVPGDKQIAVGLLLVLELVLLLRPHIDQYGASYPAYPLELLLVANAWLCVVCACVPLRVGNVHEASERICPEVLPASWRLEEWMLDQAHTLGRHLTRAYRYCPNSPGL